MGEEAEMSDVVWGVIRAAIVAATAALVSYMNGWEAGYWRGQIDAINGVIKYELVKQPDGSVEWEEK